MIVAVPPIPLTLDTPVVGYTFQASCPGIPPTAWNVCVVPAAAVPDEDVVLTIVMGDGVAQGFKPTATNAELTLCTGIQVKSPALVNVKTIRYNPC